MALQTMVQIRERTFLDVLDLALIVVRARPFLLLRAALAGILPFALLNAWLLTDPNFGWGQLFVLFVLEVPWATAPLTIVLGGLMFGRPPSAWKVLKTLVQSSLTMVLFQVFLRGLLLCVFVLYPIVPSRFAFLNEVILLEEGRWWKTAGRTSQLCERRGGDLLGRWIAQLAFGSLFVFAFWAGSGALLQSLVRSQTTWDPSWSDVLGARFHVGLWIAVAFFAVVRFLTYLDQRIRLEGWEVNLRLRAVGKGLEEAA